MSPAEMDAEFWAAFWAKVDRSGPLCPLLGSCCWLWLGGSGGKGGPEQRYGQYRARRAHRLAYEAVIGAIPDGRVLDHLCRNRLCVNPAHLEPVTHQINILRGVGHAAENAKRTICKNGHPLTGENLLVAAGRRHSRRVCRTCAAERLLKWKAKNAA